MALLDGDRFEGKFRDGVHSIDAGDLMRRMVKEDLLKFDGRPLFPERKAYTVEYELSDGEADLYQRVTEYVRDEFNRAEQAGSFHSGDCAGRPVRRGAGRRWAGGGHHLRAGTLRPGTRLRCYKRELPVAGADKQRRTPEMTDFRKTSIDELRPSVSDDRDGCLFTATVHRKPVADLKLANETLDIPQKTSGKRR